MAKHKVRVGLINLLQNEDAPPLNLVYLGTALEKAGVCEAKIIDSTFSCLNIIRQIKELDLVGISSVTKYYPKACLIARSIKRVSNIPVCIGGSHITLMPSSLSRDFDFGVIGEGELTIAELCKMLYKNGGFSSQILKEIPGLIYWQEDSLKYTQFRQPIEDLDFIPLPDYRLLDSRYFGKRWIIWDDTVGRSFKIFTSRGCPYNCIFCASKQIWKTTRLHSAQRMFEEVRILVKRYGVDHIYIDDDLFILDKERLKSFSLLLQKHDLIGRVFFHCSARTNILDDDMCLILKEIGVKAVNFGFESGSDRVLKCLKGEGISVDYHKCAVLLCKRYGFKVWGSFMLGSPCETIEDMKKTQELIDFCIDQGCHKLGVFVATPFPGTLFWEIGLHRGTVSANMNWEELDYERCERPWLLHPSCPESEFKRIFKETVAKADSMLRRHNLLMILRWRYKKILRRIIENPLRMFNMLKNILLNRKIS